MHRSRYVWLLRWTYVLLLMLLVVACGDGNSNGDQDEEPSQPDPTEEWVLETCDNDQDDNGNALVDCRDPQCYAHASCVVIPSDPASLATELGDAERTSFADSISFLYDGDTPIQLGVDVDRFDEDRIGVLRGEVRSRDGQALEGVAVSVLGRAEFGRTYSREDGRFDIALNAGGREVVQYEKEGYLPVQRRLDTRWNDFTRVEDVVLVPLDDNVTTIEFSQPIEVARGAVIEDDNGQRQATIMFQQNTVAEMVFPNGARESLETIDVRATEYTVGDQGPSAMPGQLPASSQYTYATEFSIDEAVAAGASTVEFDRPAVIYVENFVGFPVGSAVPTGYFDRNEAQWVPADDGRVVEVTSINGDTAKLTVTDGSQDEQSEQQRLGISAAERRQLAQLYEVGQQLWRVPIDHLTPVDLNWPGRYPPGTSGPPQMRSTGPPTCGGSQEPGSIIECERQALGKQLPVAGTPYTLAYRSDRVPGRLPTVEIPLHDGGWPDDLKRVEVEMVVAGVTYEESYEPPDIPAFQIWAWDRLDAYGRLVQGTVPATITTRYIFPSNYAVADPVTMVASSLRDQIHPLDHDQEGRSFAQSSPQTETITVDRAEITIARTAVEPLGGWDVSRESLGGWTLDVHHRYDPIGRVLHFGGGGDWHGGRQTPTINHVAGRDWDGGHPSPMDNSEPAHQTRLGEPGALEVAPDGSVYVAELHYSWVVRRVHRDGRIEHVAGREMEFGDDPIEFDTDSGDGGPATDAVLATIEDLAIGNNGDLYVLTGEHIWRVHADGSISVVAGGGDIRLDEPGNPVEWADASDVALSGRSLDIGPDGSFYIGVRNGVVRIMPDDRTHYIAGGPDAEPCQFDAGDICPAVGTQLTETEEIAVKRDGRVVLLVSADLPYRAVMEVSSDGTVRRLHEGLAGAKDLAIGPNDEIYVAIDENSSDPERGVGVYEVLPDGETVPVVGRTSDNPQLGRILADGGPAHQPVNQTYSVAASPGGQLYFGAATSNRMFTVWRVDGLFPGHSGSEISIPSPTGDLLYVFNENGRHLRTLDAYTGEMMYEFEYDADHRLLAVVDGDGNGTFVERTANGEPTALVSPYGQRTALTTNTQGYIDSASDPTGNISQFGYTQDGLLGSATDPEGNTSTYVYDPAGRLSKATNPRGGEKTLERRLEDNARQVVTITSAEDRQTEYGTWWDAGKVHRSITGATTVEAKPLDEARRQIEMPDGTTATSELAPDPIFGMKTPFARWSQIVTPSGLTKTIEVERSAELVDASRPVDVASREEVVRVNGREWTSNYDGATRTSVVESPEGRTVETTHDRLGRAVRVSVPGLEDRVLDYDDRGRPSQVQVGSRSWSFDYSPQGFLQSVTDPLGRTTEFDRDASGRAIREEYADASQLSLDWDGNGFPISVEPDDGAHYTMDNDYRGQATRWTAASASGQPAIEYTYDLDDRLETVEFSDGRIVDFDWDDHDRLAAVDSPSAQIEYGYDDTTGHLMSIDRLEGGQSVQTLSYQWDGPLVEQTSWSGEVDGSVERSYDDDLRVVSRSVGGDHAVDFDFDDDGKLTQAGQVMLDYYATHGLLEEATLGDTEASYTYTSYGEVERYQVDDSGSALFEVDYVYDELGRVDTLEETVDGTTRSFAYEYDERGRLVEVLQRDEQSGAFDTVESYGFDANGNRTRVDNAHHDLAATDIEVDGQDRLTRYGELEFSYDAAGRLETKTDNGSGQTTSYDYDDFGNLRAVDLPDGTTVEYPVDGQGRRIGRRVLDAQGQLIDERYWLYKDALNPTAELDGQGRVTKRFVYASRPHVPDYMVAIDPQTGSETTYRIVSDHLGSVRLVVDVDTGDIAQKMRYDAWGNVLEDTDAGFQPFGYAGGLYDGQTGLTRFGARDYDPLVGRWTAKDPIGLASRDANLYRYAGGDPINLLDGDGEAIPVILAGAGVGALFGVGGELVSNAISGRRTTNGGLAKAAGIGAIGGAIVPGVGGAAAKFLGTKGFGIFGKTLLGGAAGGGASSGATYGLSLIGSCDEFSLSDFLSSIGIGAALGALMGGTMGAAKKDAASMIYNTRVHSLRNQGRSFFRKAPVQGPVPYPANPVPVAERVLLRTGIGLTMVEPARAVIDSIRD